MNKHCSYSLISFAHTRITWSISFYVVHKWTIFFFNGNSHKYFLFYLHLFLLTFLISLLLRCSFECVCVCALGIWLLCVDERKQKISNKQWKDGNRIRQNVEVNEMNAMLLAIHSINFHIYTVVVLLLLTNISALDCILFRFYYCSWIFFVRFFAIFFFALPICLFI